MRCTLSGLKRNNMCSRTCYKADAMFGARAVGEKLTTAARLAGRAVCVIGSEDPFPGSGRLGKVDRCIARVVCNIALDRKAGPVTFGLHAKEGICPGGQMWCGLAAASPMLKFFLSTGTPEFDSRRTAVGIPTNCPARFNNAPPLLPLFSAASVWMRSSLRTPSSTRTRLTPLTITQGKVFVTKDGKETLCALMQQTLIAMPKK